MHVGQFTIKTVFSKGGKSRTEKICAQLHIRRMDNLSFLVTPVEYKLFGDISCKSLIWSSELKTNIGRQERQE